MQFNPKHWNLVSEIEHVSDIYMLADERFEEFACGEFSGECWEPTGIYGTVYNEPELSFEPYYAMPISKMLELINRAAQEDELK